MPGNAASARGRGMRRAAPQASPTGRNGPLVLACSPREGGNCDYAAALIRETAAGARILYLRDFAVSPCVSCGRCLVPGTPCPLTGGDDSASLFAALEQASALVIVSPIYFYHLPAQLKALVDRSQPWWAKANRADANPQPQAAGPLNALPEREAGAVLVGARETGEKLFAGSVLTLRYWLRVFGYTLVTPLTLYGLDGLGELARNAEHAGAVSRYAAEAFARPPAQQGGNP